MAHNYKISLYAVDHTASMTTASTIKTAITAWLRTVFDMEPRQLHVERSEEYEYQGEYTPENDPNCDLAILEGRFNHPQYHGATVKPGDVYRHFKGHMVKIIAVSKGTEYGETNVVYEHMENHTVWHRPIEMFLSPVDAEKYPDAWQKQRFEKISDVWHDAVNDPPIDGWMVWAIKKGCSPFMAFMEDGVWYHHSSMYNAEEDGQKITHWADITPPASLPEVDA